MAKLSGENFLLKHGEKIVLGVGAGLGLLFAIMGLKDTVNSSSSSVAAAELTKEATRIQEEMKGGKSPEPLFEWLTRPVEIRKVEPSQFALKESTFEPILQPDTLREKPRVLNVVDSQWDVIRSPMRALDVQTEVQDGVFRITQYGVLVNQQSGAGVTGLKIIDDIVKKKAPPMLKEKEKKNPKGPKPPENSTSAKRDDKAVVYKKPDEIRTMGGSVAYAEAVHPLQGVLIHAAFPMREQFKEIKNALRIQKDKDAMEASAVDFSKNGTEKLRVLGPVMAGYEVQRREIPIDVKFDQDKAEDNKDYEWQELNHEEIYRIEIGCRRVEVEPIPPELAPFVPKDQHRFWLQMPKLADNLGSYPKIRMKEIREVSEKYKRDNPDLPSRVEPENRNIQIGGDPFDSGDARPKAGPAPPGAVPGAPPGGAPAADPNKDLPPEYVMLRFIDTTVKPGYKYYYRIRVKLMNPNFGKKADTVRLPKYTEDRELLPDDWYEVNKEEPITLPIDSFLYGYEQKAYMDKAEDMGKQYDRKVKDAMGYDDVASGRSAVVQLQTWMPKIALDTGTEEPVGSWIVTEFPVSVGEYIGKRQLVELPLWSAAQSNYILRKVSGTKFFGIKDQDKQPKGWPINFRTDSILVDFDGGRTTYNSPRDRIREESDGELLIVNADGLLTVRRVSEDSANSDRRTRESEWNDWLKRVKGRTKDSGDEGSKGKDSFAPRKE